MVEREIRRTASSKQIWSYCYFNWSSYFDFRWMGVQSCNELGCGTQGYERNWQKKEVIVLDLFILYYDLLILFNKKKKNTYLYHSIYN